MRHDQHRDRRVVDQLVAEAPEHELTEAAKPPTPDDEEVAAHLPHIGKQFAGPALDDDGPKVHTCVS
jgi:hypothetical protein